MSMHTGQHLVSAICDATLSLPTLSWSMPPHPSTEPCYIELPRGLTQAEARAIEDRANELVMTTGRRGDEEDVKVWIENRLQGSSGTGTPVDGGRVRVNDEDEEKGLGLGGAGAEWGDRESRGLPKDYADGV